MKRILKYIFGLLILGSVASFVLMTDLQAVKSQLSSSLPAFALILLISLFGYITGALAWRHCFSNTQVGFLKLLYTRSVGELIALFNPTNIVAGEGFKILSLKSDVSNKEDLIDSIVLSRLVMIVSQLVLGIVCLMYLFGISWIWAVLMVICFIISVQIFFRPDRSSSLNAPSSSEEYPQTIPGHLKKVWSLFQQSLARIKNNMTTNPKGLALAFGWNILHWMLGALEIFVILLWLKHPTSFLGSLSIDTGVVILKSLAGFIPGQLGVEEISNKLMLDVIGLKATSLWLSVSILRRAKQLVWLSLAGLAFLFVQYFLKIKKSNNGHTVCNT